MFALPKRAGEAGEPAEQADAAELHAVGTQGVPAHEGDLASVR